MLSNPISGRHISLHSRLFRVFYNNPQSVSAGLSFSNSTLLSPASLKRGKTPSSVQTPPTVFSSASPAPPRWAHCTTPPPQYRNPQIHPSFHPVWPSLDRYFHFFCGETRGTTKPTKGPNLCRHLRGCFLSTTTDRYSLCISADPTPVCFSTRCFHLPSPWSKTMRYLNSLTWGSNSFE